MDVTVEMNKDGRLTIPIQFRHAIDMVNGGQLTIRNENGKLQILTTKQLLDDAKAAIREFIPDDISFVEQLSSERQREAELEQADSEKREQSST
ncbi:MAG: hypothetical protein F6K42_05460 [Leptolyngbya sp. SIO1D8]|nr:hypothetical protein [Leptolyngbya sp. SIO1D8]